MKRTWYSEKLLGEVALITIYEIGTYLVRSALKDVESLDAMFLQNDCKGTRLGAKNIYE